MSRILPILFNTEMVKAILDGRKSCTRRLPSKSVSSKWNDYYEWVSAVAIPGSISLSEIQFYEQHPPYQVGDILYVRETFGYPIRLNTPEKYIYKADEVAEKGFNNKSHIWHPSIHMPKEAARIFLKVTDVRVERLQDITEEQTENEGFEFIPPCLHQVSEESYCDLDGPCNSKIKYCDMSSGELFGIALWNTTVKEDWQKWESNPYVWVISFERCEKPEVTQEN